MAKFCSQCGTQLLDDGVCPNCPATSETQQNSTSNSLSQMTLEQIGQSVTGKVGELGKSVSVDSSDADNPTISIANKAIKPRTIIKISALVLCVLFFFPLFTVSCGNTTFSFNGINTVFGKTISMYGDKEKIDGQFGFIFLLIIPAALLLISIYKKNLQINKNFFPISILLSVLGIIALCVLKSKVHAEIIGGDDKNSYSISDFNMVKVKYTIWYNLSMLLYVVSGALAVITLIFSKKKNPPEVKTNL